MPNMSAVRNKMPVLPPETRARSFDEVALGYTEEQAIDEAKRCLACKNRPCVSGCPVGIAIPDFLAKVAEGDFEGAYQIITEASSLPAVCGRVCPQETQCEGKCVRGIKGESVGIGRLERFVADHHKKTAFTPAKPNGFSVAVVGSGPSGLSCAGELIKRGYAVTVYEALHTAGGVLVYGIPEFRLPKSIVADEIDNLKARGVKFALNTVIGRTLTVDELRESHDAVFLGSGAGLPRFMGIPGENLKGVYSANEYLTRINLMKAYKEDSDTPILKGEHICVVGGGNVAMDAARCALRLGAKSVTVVYRRSFDELPARKEEVEHAKEEGIVFAMLTNPTAILGENGFVTGLSCLKMELGAPDESGRRSPVPVEGSEFTIPCDTVIMSIGTAPNPLLKSTTPSLATNRRGGIVVEEETGETSLPGVYAGGDAVTGAATVILAMGAGKRSAAAIDELLCGEKRV